MTEIRQLKAAIDAMVREFDPRAIVQGTFYDRASGRFFVTLVRGRRRIEATLPVREFSNGRDKVRARLRHAIEGLEKLPDH